MLNVTFLNNNVFRLFVPNNTVFLYLFQVITWLDFEHLIDFRLKKTKDGSKDQTEPEVNAIEEFLEKSTNYVLEILTGSRSQATRYFERFRNNDRIVWGGRSEHVENCHDNLQERTEKSIHSVKYQRL